MIDPATLVDTTTVTPTGELNLYFDNPRRGDVEAIARSLMKLKQYKPLTGNIGTLTGRPNEILAGNHTLMAIRQLAKDDPTDERWRRAKVHWVDVDDEEARLINIADNRIAELGGYDNESLLAALNGMPDIDLSAVGYSVEDLADMRALLEESAADLTSITDRPSRQREDGLIDSNDIETDGLGYADAAGRMIVMLLPIPQFVWAQEQLEKLRADRDLGTNAAVLLALLSDYSGQEPPAADAPIPEDADTTIPGNKDPLGAVARGQGKGRFANAAGATDEG
jgi:hypothetical protein